MQFFLKMKIEMSMATYAPMCLKKIMLNVDGCVNQRLNILDCAQQSIISLHAGLQKKQLLRFFQIDKFTALPSVFDRPLDGGNHLCSIYFIVDDALREIM